MRTRRNLMGCRPLDPLPLRSLTAGQPDRGFADVGYLERRRVFERLALGAPRQSRAVGGAALVVTEATAVTARRTASAPRIFGIYDDGHVGPGESCASSTAQKTLPARSSRTRDAKPARRGRGKGAVGSVAAGGWHRSGRQRTVRRRTIRYPRARSRRDRAIVPRSVARSVRSPPASTSSKSTARTADLIHQFLSPLVNTRGHLRRRI